MKELKGVLVRRAYWEGKIRFSVLGAIRCGMDAIHANGTHRAVYFYSPAREGSGYCPLCGTDMIMAFESHLPAKI